MTLSLTAVALPLWIKGLHTLQHILTVAEDHARSQGLDPDVEYPDARLIDDMRPLTFQIQNATKTVRQAVARLEGREDVPWADDEKTVGDLKKRLERTLEVVKGLDAGKVDARAGEVVDLYVPFFFRDNGLKLESTVC